MAMPMQSKNTLNRSAEVMNEGLDTPIKIEIKNEEEEPTGKSHGFICPKCEAHFLYESYFIEHIETHHEDIKVSEDLDCYTNKPANPSKSLEEVSNPQKTPASAKTVFKCDECNFSFAERYFLYNHLVSHHGASKIHSIPAEDRIFKCAECPYACSQQGSLVQHMLIHTIDLARAKSYKCTKCSNFVRSGLLKHRHKCKKLSVLAKTYKCKECSYSGPLRNSLIEHQKIHTREKLLLKCLECSYESTSKSTLVRHQRLHTGEKIYKYDLDYSRFSRKKERLLVLGEKPHKCDDCSASFETKSRLFRHQISHSEVKPFMCDVCLMSFTANYILKRHMMIHSGVKPFMCHVCLMSFTENQHVKRHMMIHTGEKPYKCGSCSYKCSRKDYLDKHRRSMHAATGP